MRTNTLGTFIALSLLWLTAGSSMTDAQTQARSFEEVFVPPTAEECPGFDDYAPQELPSVEQIEAELRAGGNVPVGLTGIEQFVNAALDNAEPVITAWASWVEEGPEGLTLNTDVHDMLENRAADVFDCAIDVLNGFVAYMSDKSALQSAIDAIGMVAAQKEQHYMEKKEEDPSPERKRQWTGLIEKAQQWQKRSDELQDVRKLTVQTSLRIIGELQFDRDLVIETIVAEGIDTAVTNIGRIIDYMQEINDKMEEFRTQARGQTT